MTEDAATSGPSITRRRSRFRRVCKWLIASVGLIVAAGLVFQFSMTEWDSHRYPSPGKLVDIGGLRLHINCTGAGTPAVIMEAGPNDSSVIWQLVQISGFTRGCSYDRAGFGWSDAPNEPRSSLNIADNQAVSAGASIVIAIAAEMGPDLRLNTVNRASSSIGFTPAT